MSRYKTFFFRSFMTYNTKRFITQSFITFRLQMQHEAKQTELKIRKKVWNHNRPEVSAEVPLTRPNMEPSAFSTATILLRTGRLWMTKDTSLCCTLHRLSAWPSNPKPVTSVAAWQLYWCIRCAAVISNS